jgi:6-pyruvoyl-tetrahydropterin synthase
MPVRKRWIRVGTQFRGIHSWPECPHGDVAFLKHPHRHTFKIEVKVEVAHLDREIEFFKFQHAVDRALNTVLHLDCKEIEPVHLGRKSCEEIAEDLYGEISRIYPYREMVISVSEDGEVAAEIEFEPFEPED